MVTSNLILKNFSSDLLKNMNKTGDKYKYNTLIVFVFFQVESFFHITGCCILQMF